MRGAHQVFVHLATLDLDSAVWRALLGLLEVGHSFRIFVRRTRKNGAFGLGVTFLRA